MQNPNTFFAAGWDFIGELGNGPSGDWAQPTGGGYMILSWQLPESEWPALPTFSGGSGEPDDPYLLSTAEDLNSIGHNPRLMAAHFKLTNDIDLIGIKFFAIASTGYPYTGVFDGNGRRISNFSYASTYGRHIGLFRYVDGETAEIKDLGLIGPNVDVPTGRQVGTLVGRLWGGTVTSCYAQGGSVSGRARVGGLVGVGGDDAAIINSHATCSVMGNNLVGGLVGINYGTTTNCYATGDVWGDTRVGGLVGQGYGITNCYATGSVSGDEGVGGLAGHAAGTTSNCYSVGRVTGRTDVGGLAGERSAPVYGSYWDTNTSGQTASAAGMRRTTAQMQMESTFTSFGWDFVGESVCGTEDVWSICEGVDYPKLAWQSIIGDFDYDSRVGLADLAIFAASWHGTDSSFFCGGTDLTNDDNVDFDDLKELADNWLRDGIWNLAIRDFIIVDDFENYDSGEDRIWYAWRDGAGYVVDDPPPPSYGGNGTGSAVGDENTASFTEETIVHGGSQSMPFAYDNTGSRDKAYYSEIERTWNTPQDWTRYRVKALTLWFHGDPGNAAEQLYVAVEDSAGKIKVVNYNNPNAVLLGAWREWKIDMKEFSDAGVNLKGVKKMYIGVGDRGDPKPGGTGTFYIDDIRLYRAG
jgi:hypothetical protein